MKIKRLALAGILTALSIVLYEFLDVSIPPTASPLIKISFGIIPLFFIGYYCGPLYSGICAIIIDILGFFIFPTGYTFFIGYTVNTFISGLTFGLLRKSGPKLEGRKGLLIIILSEIIITLITIPLFAYEYISHNYQEKYSEGLLPTICIFAVLFNSFVVLFAAGFSHKQNANMIIIAFIIVQYVTSLGLTPLWQKIVINLDYFSQWIIRLLSVPLTTIINSILTYLAILPLQKKFKQFD